ncbi:MAG: hypothetical protein IPO38_08480 [Rhodocyclaceae bacterium]|nr:hypothetical protein [Rhodocyclaceae bacterium]
MNINELRFSDEDQRIIANTEQLYEGMLAALRERKDIGYTRMAWKTINAAEYLYAWPQQGGEKSLGRRSADTEKQLTDFDTSASALDSQIEGISSALEKVLAQYKALHLPQIMSLPAKILRLLDLQGHLGKDLIVVGTNAFAAYEIEAGQRFAHGMDETEDFDLSWCRDSEISLHATTRITGSPLFTAIKQVDSSFRINDKRPYRAINNKGYEVELLTAPSVMKSLATNEIFSTAAIPEQEWLLKGNPYDISPAPVMAHLHPLSFQIPAGWRAQMWLANKPERRSDKKERTQSKATSCFVSLPKQCASPTPSTMISSSRYRANWSKPSTRGRLATNIFRAPIDSSRRWVSGTDDEQIFPEC